MSQTTSLMIAGLTGDADARRLLALERRQSEGKSRRRKAAADGQLRVFSLQVTTTSSKLFQGLECSNNWSN